jgi:hypothetical protein
VKAKVKGKGRGKSRAFNDNQTVSAAARSPFGKMKNEE